MSRIIILLLLLSIPLITNCQNSKKVLLIGIDGCRTDALLTAHTPIIDSLINSGIWAPEAINDDVTLSGPSWSSILCGVRSDKHGVTDNEFVGQNYAEYPPFFFYLNQVDSTIQTASICNWSLINAFIIKDLVQDKVNALDDTAVTDASSAYLSSEDPDVLFLHFDGVDSAGHSSGFSPDTLAYISAIEKVDSDLGKVLSAVSARPNYDSEDWLILLVTDHGGIEFSHGGESMEEQDVFIIVNKRGVDMQTIQGGHHTDIVPSIFNHLCIPIQDEWNLTGTSLIPDCTSSLDNNTIDNLILKIVPNPSTGEIQIDLENLRANLKVNIEVLSADGILVYSQLSYESNNKIDLAHLSKGLYNIVIKQGSKLLGSEKFIKI